MQNNLYKNTPDGCLEDMYHKALHNVLTDKVVRAHRVKNITLRVVQNPDKLAINSELVIARAEITVLVEYSNEHVTEEMSRVKRATIPAA